MCSCNLRLAFGYGIFSRVRKFPKPHTLNASTKHRLYNFGKYYKITNVKCFPLAGPNWVLEGWLT